MKYLTQNTIDEIIELADRFFGKDNESKIVSSIELDSKVMEHLLDNDRLALTRKVSSLSDEEMAELESLVVLGQGFSGESVKDWNELYLAAMNNDDSQSYVLGKKKLSSFLRAGMAKVQESTEL